MIEELKKEFLHHKPFYVCLLFIIISEIIGISIFGLMPNIWILELILYPTANCGIITLFLLILTGVYSLYTGDKFEKLLDLLLDSFFTRQLTKKEKDEFEKLKKMLKSQDEETKALAKSIFIAAFSKLSDIDIEVYKVKYEIENGYI